MSEGVGDNLVGGLVLGSKHLSDCSFMQSVRECTIEAGSFHHADHLRFAWIVLHTLPFEEAFAEIRAAIRRLGAHYGKPNLYHETITRGWIALLRSHDEKSFTDFLIVNGPRLSAQLLHEYWAPELLSSELARTSWVPPNLRPLPNPSEPR